MSGTKLTQLFLFNPSWGPREGQEEEKVVLHWPDHLDANENTNKKCVKQTNKSALTNQVVFHWPANMDANTRVRSVGLIEAVVRWPLQHFNCLIEHFSRLVEHFNVATEY